MEPASNERMWTALDVARYLSCSRAHVYHLADRGALSVLRIGALLRFRPEDVRAMGNATATLKPKK